MADLNGMPVVLHDSVVEVKRSWRERLLSWPWRPWRKTKFVRNALFADGSVYVSGGRLHITREQWNTMSEHLTTDQGRMFPLSRNPLLAGELFRTETTHE